MHKVIPIEQLRRGPAAALFEGGEDVSISIFVTGFNRGEGPSLHLHPYPEVFVVKTGTAAFTVGDTNSSSPTATSSSCRRTGPTASKAPATARFAC